MHKLNMDIKQTNKTKYGQRFCKGNTFKVTGVFYPKDKK